MMLDARRLYDAFDAPVTDLDCGAMCAPHNPSGKPFCCDICHAVPAAHPFEWRYLQDAGELWHVWRGDECPQETPQSVQALRDETPEHMLLLACLGPQDCVRPLRALSCRQFPFFPYITSAGRFIGLAGEWRFQAQCWVLNHLERVTPAFREQFVSLYDDLFYSLPGEYDSYAALSEEMRAEFAAARRRIPLLHRRGGIYRISPVSERMRKG